MSQSMWLMAAALGAEIVLLLVVLLLVAFVREQARKRRDRLAVKALVARVRNGRAEREQALLQFLGERLGLSGETLQAAKVALLRSEQALLQRFAGVYRLRDADAASRFDIDLYQSLEAYQSLGPGEGGGSTEEAKAAAEAHDAELERLRKENTRLSEELQITMDTMSRMLNEYTTMFAADGQPDDSAPIATTPDALPDDSLPEALPGQSMTGEAADLDDLDVSQLEVDRSAGDQREAVAQATAGDELDSVDLVEPEPTADQPPGDSLDELQPESEPATRSQAGDDLDADMFAAFDEVLPADVEVEQPVATELADPEDVIAEVMREAADREKSARGLEPGEVDEALDSAEVSSAPGQADGAAEFDGGALDDLDDLFDAAANPVHPPDKAAGAG